MGWCEETPAYPREKDRDVLRQNLTELNDSVCSDPKIFILKNDNDIFSDHATLYVIKSYLYSLHQDRFKGIFQ